jgi:hypothetical protein
MNMSMTGGGSIAEKDAIAIVDVNGFNYFVVDSDLSKGDRRGDGKSMSDFFTVSESPAPTIINVRQSRRVQKKRDLLQTLCLSNEVLELSNAVVEGSSSSETVRVIGNKRHSAKKESKEAMLIAEAGDIFCIRTNINDVVEEKVAVVATVQTQHSEENDDFDMFSCVVGLRLPEDGIRCAGRKGTTRLLWVHEYFVVNDSTSKQGNGCMYQALQFLLGCHLPAGQVTHMTEDMSRDIWVLGVSHVPADQVRQFSTRKARYLFHSESNEGDARTALFGRCPELVRVESCLKWHNIHAISTEVPRVVHPEDVRTRRVHVAGRKNHFLCGVAAVEDLVNSCFTLSVLPRQGFCMYPEERLGMELNSASMMWESIEDIFSRIRGCMSSGRQGTSSATFSMPLLATVYGFWRVIFFANVLRSPLFDSCFVTY